MTAFPNELPTSKYCGMPTVYPGDPALDGLAFGVPFALPVFFGVDGPAPAVPSSPAFFSKRALTALMMLRLLVKEVSKSPLPYISTRVLTPTRTIASVPERPVPLTTLLISFFAVAGLSAKLGDEVEGADSVSFDVVGFDAEGAGLLDETIKTGVKVDREGDSGVDEDLRGVHCVSAQRQYLQRRVYFSRRRT